MNAPCNKERICQMRQVRKTMIALTIESSKTKPFKCYYRAGCDEDKFMIINKKQYKISEILEKVELVVETYLSGQFSDNN